MNTKVCRVRVNGAGDESSVASRSHPLEKLDCLALTQRYHRGQEISSQTHPAEYWYRLLFGAARRGVVRPDGRRQIIDLLLPGDFFGFPVHDECGFAVEAIIEDTRVSCYPRRRVETLANSDPMVAGELCQIAFGAISRLQAQLLILGRITALEKVGSFLVDMADRLSGGHADRVVLPISRYDIADYLGISVETVSRALTGFKRRGIISLAGTRSIHIVNRDALEEGKRDNHHRPAPRSRNHLPRMAA
jgi:CRP/FNR family nitrogen fixation transcriptional regulator